jgi:methionyl-tRNA synthetase
MAYVMPSRFYVTTPIYYVNDVPHLGHAYTSVATDAFRRYNLLRGRESRMLTGTDEHGLKIERAAAAHGTTPQAFADDMSQRFRAAWPELLVFADDFIRTTEERHIRLVQELWRRIAARGDLYLGDYEDWYCVGCESYKTEKELLPGNLCPLHFTPVEKVREPTYFFRLGKYQKPLLDFYGRHPQFVEPESRRNEVVSFVEGGLKDLSVSRTSFTWGIPVPGDSKHVMFVWFDALANYWTALGPEGDPLRRFWPKAGNGARVVHVVGKDILRFHAVYWPAFLLAAGFDDDELPSQVFAHGFLTVDGQKMSKSLRNAVDPIRLAKELGPDVLRYQLLRAIAFGQDGDFDHAAMFERYNADLGKNLGNLLSRTLGLCAKLTPGTIPRMGAKTELETLLWEEVTAAVTAEIVPSWENLQVHQALVSTIGISSSANQYVDRAAPWAVAKQGDQVRVETILATLLEVLGWLSVLIWPAMPKKSDAMRVQLGLPPVRPSVGKDLWPGSAESTSSFRGEVLGTAVPLFPTYDTDAVNALLDKLVPKVAPDVSTEASPEAPSPGPKATAIAGSSGATASATVTYDQFAAIDLRVGVVLACEPVPKKDKLLRLSVDLGEPAPRQIVAGLARTFTPEALVGRRVVVVANLAPRDFGKGLVSHGMLLATGAEDALELATVPGDAKAGMRLK